MQCPKCGGTGRIDCYSHIAGGICFHCNGKGYVSSNGKAIKSVKTTQLKHVLFGLNKRDTKLICDLVLTGGCVYSDDPKDTAGFERMVSLGHMVKRTVNYWPKPHDVYEPAHYFTTRSINVLIDWSK